MSSKSTTCTLRAGRRFRTAVRCIYQVLDAERADAVIDNVGELVRELPAGCCSATRPNEEIASRNQRLKAELNRQLRDRGILITRVQIARLNARF